MGGALLIVWGVALLAIVALGGLLAWTLRREMLLEKASRPQVDGGDTLLFYYEEESVRSTPRDQVIVRIPGMAWEGEWQDDLLRLEVLGRDPAAIRVPAAWGAAKVLAAYALRAYRMTEMGNDVRVERFAAPIDVFLTTDVVEGELRFGVNREEGWTLAPLAALSPQALEGVDLPAGRGWAAASIAGMREICLVQMPAPGRGMGEQDETIEP
jgi:hypothetical protein